MTREEAIYKIRGHKSTVCLGCMHPQEVGWCENHCQIKEAFDMAIEALQEKKMGKWIATEKGLLVTVYECSECKRHVIDDTGYDVAKDYPFCHCGADMRGDDNA